MATKKMKTWHKKTNCTYTKKSEGNNLKARAFVTFQHKNGFSPPFPHKPARKPFLSGAHQYSSFLGLFMLLQTMENFPFHFHSVLSQSFLSLSMETNTPLDIIFNVCFSWFICIHFSIYTIRLSHINYSYVGLKKSISSIIKSYSQ
jgi:hypothetical protein